MTDPWNAEDLAVSLFDTAQGLADALGFAFETEPGLSGPVEEGSSLVETSRHWRAPGQPGPAGVDRAVIRSIAVFVGAGMEVTVLYDDPATGRAALAGHGDAGLIRVLFAPGGCVISASTEPAPPNPPDKPL